MGTAATHARSGPTGREMEIDRTGAAHVERVCDVSDRFFETESEAIALACRALASRFRKGGRLLVLASGPSASDADHVAVEFVHPVIVGKRALPARAVDPADLEGLRAIARPDDIALVVHHGPCDATSGAALGLARERGLLTIGLFGGDEAPAPAVAPDHGFTVPSSDALVVQEVQETLYHILWELVHVFLEYGGNAESGGAR